MVDSQMVNCNRFGYQQAIPHSPFIASTSKVLDLRGRKEDPSSGPAKPSQASTSLSRQIHQWLGSRKTSHPYTKKAYWTRAVSRGQPFRDYPNMKLIILNKSSISCLFRLSFHVVGKKVCLVILWPNPARRDKPWNYIPLKFQRYTKLILATWNLYGHVENVWGIPFPKRMKQKYCFLNELFQE